MRSVPLHPALVELGFVDHVQRLHVGDEAPIFDRWSRNSRGQFGEASKWLNRYLERCGAKTAPDLTFHSFRHTFIDGLRDAGFTEPEIKPVVGHSMSGVTRGYGRAQDIPVRRRFEMIRQLPHEAWAGELFRSCRVAPMPAHLCVQLDKTLLNGDATSGLAKVRALHMDTPAGRGPRASRKAGRRSSMRTATVPA